MGSTGGQREERWKWPQDDDPGGDALAFDVSGSPDQVAVARRTLGRFLSTLDVPTGVVHDVQLIASELVTNAIQHGVPGPVGIEVQVRPGLDVTLMVDNVGSVDALPPLSAWHAPNGLSVGGRGLGIVRQLAADVEVRGDAHHATVVCRCSWEQAS
jgi:serine/threonine-protein kinase RsbW